MNDPMLFMLFGWALAMLSLSAGASMAFRLMRGHPPVLPAKKIKIDNGEKAAPPEAPRLSKL